MAPGTASEEALQRREDLRQALTEATNELAAVENDLQFRRKRELRSWNDEAPALEVYASAMGQTADVMRGELEKLRSDMHAAMQSTGHVPGKGPTGNLSAESQAAESLNQEIGRLVKHMGTIDKQLAEVSDLFAYIKLCLSASCCQICLSQHHVNCPGLLIRTRHQAFLHCSADRCTRAQSTSRIKPSGKPSLWLCKTRRSSQWESSNACEWSSS